MTRHWTLKENSLELFQMPFYWRLSKNAEKFLDIPQTLPLRVYKDEEFDYLRLNMTDQEWDVLETAYKQNANIGFINDESGHLHTYGASVNSFFLNEVKRLNPQKIFEIGCGAGGSIHFLAQNGWKVIGIDPSDYSLSWSKKTGFELINSWFSAQLFQERADFFFCNDVFEHIPNVKEFAESVFNCLNYGGTFCIATTNSSESIFRGDISLFEHQHVNMFTEKSIYQILHSAGFNDIKISKGAYGNTFHITARKIRKSVAKDSISGRPSLCENFFGKISANLNYFAKIHSAYESLNCYVPLRSMAYLASVGDFGSTPIFDSNISWKGKYIDGYNQPIRNLVDANVPTKEKFFISSLTFYEEIKKTLLKNGFDDANIFSINDLV